MMCNFFLEIIDVDALYNSDEDRDEIPQTRNENPVDLNNNENPVDLNNNNENQVLITVTTSPASRQPIVQGISFLVVCRGRI